MSKKTKQRSKLLRLKIDDIVEDSLHARLQRDLTKMNQQLNEVQAHIDVEEVRRKIFECLIFFAEQSRRMEKVQKAGLLRNQINATLSVMSESFAQIKGMKKEWLKLLNKVLQSGILGVRGDIIDVVLLEVQQNNVIGEGDELNAEQDDIHGFFNISEEGVEFKNWQAQRFFHLKGWEVVLEEKGFAFEVIINQQPEDELLDILYAIQYIPVVRNALVEKFIHLSKNIFQRNHGYQKRLIEEFNRPKYYWDSLLRGETRLLYEHLSFVTKGSGMSHLEFFQTPFCSVKKRGNILLCAIRFEPEFKKENKNDLSEKLLSKAENQSEKISRLIRLAAESKDFKNIAVSRLLILSIWGMAHQGLPGTSNSNVAELLGEDKRLFTRLRQKSALKEQVVTDSVDRFQINVDFLLDGSDILGLPLELIELNLEQLKQMPEQYQLAKQNFKNFALRYAQQNISEAERVFFLGKNAWSAFEADRRKLNLFWLIRVCAALEIPVTDIMPVV